METIILYYDKENLNGRIYTSKLVDQIIKDFNNGKEDGDVIFGNLDYPDMEEVSFSKVSHKIIQLKKDEKNKTLCGVLEILDTPVGKILQKKVYEWTVKGTEIPFSCRIRGTGNVNKKTKEVENFKLKACDLIPKNTDAYKDIIEEKLQ